VDVGSVIASLSKWVYDCSIAAGLSESNAVVQVLRNGAPQDRDKWTLHLLPGSQRVTSQFATTYGYRARLDFASTSEIEVERVLSYMQQSLQNNRHRITGILHDFKYPTPVLSAREDEQSDLTAATYFVGVTGIGVANDEETLISSIVSIAVANGEKLRVVIPRYPEGSNFFKRYNVYVGTTASNVRKHNEEPIDADEYVTTIYDISTDWSGLTVSPPEQSDVRFTGLKISDDAYNIEDDPRESGNVVGIVTLSLESVLFTIRSQSHPLETVTIARTVE